MKSTTVSAMMLLALAGVSGRETTPITSAPGQTPRPAGVCTAAPKAAKLNFTLKDVAGRPVKLADFKGKVVLLNFWATWCVPCRAEIPELVDLQSAYGNDGLQVIGVSVDDPADKIRPFVDKYKINYPVLQALGNDGILDTYGPMVVVPWTIVIGRDGTICTKHVGPADKATFEKEIKALR